RLRRMSRELYQDSDPIADFEAISPFQIVERDGGIIMELDVPFVEKADLDVFRKGHELYIQLGPYRRSFILPDALHRREVTRARLDGGKLSVAFSDPEQATS
ncbi:MAG TPA: hypothetical protein VIW94_09465, partial [Acidimicrobiia bacterium]